MVKVRIGRAENLAIIDFNRQLNDELNRIKRKTGLRPHEFNAPEVKIKNRLMLAKVTANKVSVSDS